MYLSIMETTKNPKTMKHTKGPWKIDKVTPLTYSEDGAVFGAGNIKIKTPRVDVWYYEFSQKEEAEANAKLIAAAPELLEALKAIITIRAGIKGGYLTGKDGIDAIAIEAIQKAES